MDQHTAETFKRMMGLKHKDDLPKKLVDAYRSARMAYDRIQGGPFSPQTLISILVASGVKVDIPERAKKHFERMEDEHVPRSNGEEEVEAVNWDTQDAGRPVQVFFRNKWWTGEFVKHLPGSGNLKVALKNDPEKKTDRKFLPSEVRLFEETVSA